METSIRTTEGWLTFEAPTLEVARLVASASGFHVDLEPGEPGHCKLTATGNGVTIVTKGTTTYDAAEKLIRKLSHEQR
jgi:hypothetical protein